MITTNSPIVGASTADPHDALSWLGEAEDEVHRYVFELYRLCQLVGFDFRILFAQAWHETDGFTSKWWRERLNPAGIGITGDPAQNDASHTWATGTDAARAHAAHMWAYVEPNSDGMAEYWHYDPRFEAVYEAGFDGTVRTLGDLGNGKWATDPQYAEKIAAKANQIFGKENTPMATPTIFNLATDYARYGLTQGQAQEVISHRFDRGGNKPTFIVLHIQAGSTRGSLIYWTGVDASSTVMIQHDGSILKVIPESFGPWTNGDDANPTPAGQRLVNLPGNSNLHTLSIEAEGMSGSDTTPAQLDAIEWQVRDWMTRYSIPLANVIRHADINSVSRPNCPGAYYQTIINRLKATPTPTPGPIYTEPVGWPSKRGDVGITQVGDAKALLITCEVECIKPNGTVPRAYASSKAGQSGPKITQGEKHVVIANVTVPKGQRTEQWYVTEDGHRVGASGFLPKLPRA